MLDITNVFKDKDKSESQGVKFTIDIVEDRLNKCFKFNTKLID